jgi:trans-2,3-dihydro-3-hydroxyanthranilate isomerase
MMEQANPSPVELPEPGAFAMRLDFATVDVFTDRQFGGNPLAVVLNADGLNGEQMQAIAGEFNLAETTFVLPPDDPAHTAKVRIFTPKAEMPFAGHPNVGTAHVLAKEGMCYGRPCDGASMLFEEKAGLVRMDMLKTGDQVSGARLAAPQPLSLGEAVPTATIARACGLSTDDIELHRHAPIVASCGARFAIAEVRSRGVLAAARPDPAVFEALLPREHITGVHLYTHTPEDVVDVQSRMFAPLHGIPEDPATGSANVALIGLLAQLSPEATLRLSKRIGQGFDMGRPSLLHAEALKENGTVLRTLIGGECVPVTRGVLTLLP